MAAPMTGRAIRRSRRSPSDRGAMSRLREVAEEVCEPLDAMMDAPRPRAKAASPPPQAAASQAWGGSTAGDPAGQLARSQGADGSFGGDLRRTAAALLALVLLGHTRRSGLRRRAVIKAALWLQSRQDQPAAALALAALKAAERGEENSPTPDWSALADGSAEGRVLQELL